MNYKVILAVVAMAAVAAYLIVFRKKSPTGEGDIPTEETQTTSDIGKNTTTYTNTPQVNRNVETAPFTGIVTLRDANGKLNVRKTPDMNGNILAKLPQGKEVYVIENVGDWYGLTLSPFASAYVHKNYVVKKADAPTGTIGRPNNDVYAPAAIYNIEKKFKNCC